MRCSAPDCGFVGDRKFCSQCGSKMIEEEMVKVICNGVQEDGTPCETILDQKQKFCPNCGAKIDQNRFLLQSNICKICQTELKPEEKFCPECGTKRYTDTLSGSVKQGEEVKAPLQVSSVTTEKTESPDPKKDNDEQKLQDHLEPSSSENPNDKCDVSPVMIQDVVTETHSDNQTNNQEARSDDNTLSETRVLLPEKQVENNDKPITEKNEEMLNKEDTKTSQESETHSVEAFAAESVSVDKTNACDENNDIYSDPNQPHPDRTGVLKEEKPFHKDGVRHTEKEEKTDSASCSENPGGQDNKTSSDVQIKLQKEESETQKAYDASGDVKQDTIIPDKGQDSFETSGEKSDEEDEFDFIDADSDQNNQEKDCTTVFHDAVESHISDDTNSSINQPPTDQLVRNEGEGNNLEVSKLPQPDQTVLQSKDDNNHDKSSTENKAKDHNNHNKDTKTYSENNQGTTDRGEITSKTNEHVSKGSTEGTNVDTGEIEKPLEGQPVKESDKDKIQTKKEKKVAALKPQSSFRSASGSKQSQEKFTTVSFHVLIGDEFDFDSKKHKLLLRTNDNWDNNSRVFHVKRQTTKGQYEMEYNFRMPHNRINTGQPLLYKYCIFKPSKNEYIWECYLRDGYADVRSNRRLNILKSWTQFDVIEQYDGQIEKSWGKLSGLVFDWKKQLVKHAKTGVEYFCKDILDAKETYVITNCFQKLCWLLQNFRKIYLTDGRCWDDDENLFKKEVGEIVLQKMVECSTDELNKKETEVEKHERLVIFALAAVLLIDNNLVPVEANEYWKYFCKQLAMKPVNDKKQCVELDIMDAYFPDKRTVFKITFQQLAKQIANNSRSPSWLFLMPWIHFLSLTNIPYDAPVVDTKHDDNDPSWWGISSVAKEVSYFNSKTDDWDVSVSETLNRLRPMFEMDYYLPRTFIASLNLRQLTTEIRKGVVGHEVCLAALIYHLRFSMTHYRTTLTQNDQYVIDCMKYLLVVLEQQPENRIPSTVEQDEMCFIFATQLFEESTKTNITIALSTSVHIMLQCYSIYEMRVDENARHALLITLIDRYPKLTRWMDYYFPDWSKSMQQALTTWNDLFEESSTVSVTVRDSWNKQMSSLLDSRLLHNVCNNKHSMEKYVELYCQRVDTFKSTVQTVLSVTAFKAIEKGYSVNYNTMNENEAKKFGGLLSALFVQEWEKCGGKTEHDILQHFLRWPPFTQFVTIYAQTEDTKDKSKLQFFSEGCQKRLLQVVTLVQQYSKELIHGDITIETLDFIRNKDVNFAEIAELVKLKYDLKKEFISKAIQIRWKETEAYRRQLEMMGIFASLCRSLPKVDKKAVLDPLKHQDHVEWKKIKDFCKPANIDSIQDIETFDPQLCAFDISQMVFDMLPEMQRCNQSVVFKRLWTKECNKIAKDCITVDDVVSKVWHPVKEGWDAKANQIQSGEITFKEFEKVVGKLHGDNYDGLFNELKRMNIGEKQILNCINKLMKYKELYKCIAGAKAIWSFKEEFNLKGDFKDIQTIAEHTDRDVEMRAFDDNVMVTVL